MMRRLVSRWTHERSSPKRRTEESRARSRRSAGLVRSAPAGAAVAGAQGRADRTLPRLAVGDHAAADDCEAVAPYYTRFLALWPTVERLAAASLDDVLKIWAGLGYYARAPQPACLRAGRGRAARRDFSPEEIEALRALPGIGDYTAAAVAAIAYDAPAAPVDGNVERVVARLFAVEEALPAAKPEINRLAASLLPPAAYRRFRAGADGSGRDAVLAQAAGLCAVSVNGEWCRLCAWASGDLPAQGAQARRQIAARRRLRRTACRRANPFAQAAEQRPARLDDGSAGQRLDARLRRTPRHAIRAAPQRR